MSTKHRTDPIVEPERACQFARLLDRVRPTAHRRPAPPARPLTGLTAWVTSTALVVALAEEEQILSGYLGEEPIAADTSVEPGRSADARNSALRVRRLINALEVVGWPHDHYVDGMEYTSLPCGADASTFEWTPEDEA